MITPADILAKIETQETTLEIKLNRLRAQKTLLADQQNLLAEQERVVDDRIADIERELAIERIGEPADDGVSDPEDTGDDDAAV